VVRAEPYVKLTMPEMADAIRLKREFVHREILERVQAILISSLRGRYLLPLHADGPGGAPSGNEAH
jgi:hypothetical protein